MTRGFDAPTPDHVVPPNVVSPVQVNNATDSAPAESPAEPESPPVRVIPGHGNRYKAVEHGPFYFETYDDADYKRDCYGDYALKHVLGSDQSTIAATMAAMDLRREGSKAAIASGQDPDHSDHLGTVPADARQPKDIYGYPVLLKIYGSEPAARVAARAAGDYYRKVALKSGLNPQPPPKPTGGTAIPDHSWSQLETDPTPSAPEPHARKPDAPQASQPKPSIEMPRMPMEPSPVDPDDPPDWSDYRPRITYDRFTAPVIP